MLKHQLVPEHRVLNEKDAKKVLAKFNIHPIQLPKILANDPAAKSVGAKPGDILEIARVSSTAGKALAYRLVVED